MKMLPDFLTDELIRIFRRDLSTSRLNSRPFSPGENPAPLTRSPPDEYKWKAAILSRPAPARELNLKPFLKIRKGIYHETMAGVGNHALMPGEELIPGNEASSPAAAKKGEQRPRGGKIRPRGWRIKIFLSKYFKTRKGQLYRWPEYRLRSCSQIYTNV